MDRYKILDEALKRSLTRKMNALTDAYSDLQVPKGGRLFGEYSLLRLLVFVKGWKDFRFGSGAATVIMKSLPNSQKRSFYEETFKMRDHPTDSEIVAFAYCSWT